MGGRWKRDDEAKSHAFEVDDTRGKETLESPYSNNRTAFYRFTPKQEALLDYVRARIEIELLTHSHRVALEKAGEDPTHSPSLMNLTRWNSLLVKAEAKAERLRSSIGLHARYEDQRRTLKRVEKDPKARLNEKQPQPWEV